MGPQPHECRAKEILMSSNHHPTTSLPDEEFVRLFTRHQRPLFLYLLTRIPNPVEAEEILQETNIVIWRKFSHFCPGSNFLAWATQIAKYEVLKYLERHDRDKLQFSDRFVEHLVEEEVEDATHWEVRRQALMHCLGKLRPKDRELIERRYRPGENGLSLAEFLDRPVNSVYQSLGRIRRTLLECIHRELNAETGP
jgi:RNA polymerase sigma-70 factor, ECF subfamily